MPAMEMDIKQNPLTGLCILSVNFQSFLFMKHNSSYTAMAILGFPVGSSSQRWFIPPLLRVLTSRPVLFPVFLHIFTKLRLSIWLHLIYIPKLKTNLKNNQTVWIISSLFHQHGKWRKFSTAIINVSRGKGQVRYSAVGLKNGWGFQSCGLMR